MELPEGVRAVWDLEKAYREATSTRERVCINGLWRFKPAAGDNEPVPSADSDWGYFKVPGTWPLEPVRKESSCSQRMYAPAGWADRLPDVEKAWYMRKITVPAEWRGRRIAVHAEWVNSHARVFVDGREVGEVIFPGGECELTPAVQPGQTHELAILTAARPISPQGTFLPYDEAPVESKMQRRGLCGDVFLTSSPTDTRITDVRVDTSVRQRTLTVTTALQGLKEGSSYVLRARVTNRGKEVLTAESEPFTSQGLENGRRAFSKEWKNPKLWDIHTPQNKYDVAVELTEGNTTLDAYYPVRFGFREFWIQGRDFILNGSRVHLRAAPLNSAQINTATASYEGACETIRRLKWWGYDAAYTHNYDCRPGSHVGFEEILRAADDVGLLLGFALPHMRDYDWSGDQPEKRTGYERHLEWYVKCSQNHPSVVMYSQNHNSLAYADDENPQRIPLVLDCIFPGNLTERLRQVYSRERILRQFDKVRPLYNHSGPSREMYTMNCYLNWVPMQERSEWFARWAEYGARPLFVVEYGEPYEASFLNLRGPWSRVRSKDLFQYQYTEWAAQTRGDAAFELHEFEKVCLGWEAGRFRRKEPFNMGDYPMKEGLHMDVPNLRGVQAEFIRQTWPYIRTLGLSGFNIWREPFFCFLREGARTARTEYKVAWDNLQRPGFSPDFCEASPLDSMPYSLGARLNDWHPNVRGATFRKYNQPLLAFVGGKPSHFTERGHNYQPGQTVEKQIIVVNDSRRLVECRCEWSASVPDGPRGSSGVRVEPGENARILVRFGLPKTLARGTYEIKLKATFSTGGVREDSFAIHVLAPRRKPKAAGKTALYDPNGETAKLLSELGFAFVPVGAEANLRPYRLLVIGKGALTVHGPGPDLSRVPGGLKVVMFEQSSAALEQRLGFRVQEYGLRQAFTRVPGHPMLNGLADEHLRDWHGEATLVPPALPLGDYYSYPKVKWCGFEVARPGRCGNRGNVCSVMIEKPAAGDFLPIVDGGFALQYSPLMLYREGKGIVLFCQMDVTGRTEEDPAATKLAANIMDYAQSYNPMPQRRAVYAGEPAGLEHLKAAGAAIARYDEQALLGNRVLVMGPGAASQLDAHAARVRKWINSGGHVLALGLPQDEVEALLPFPVRIEVKEHISCYFEPSGPGTLLSGIGCGELMIRDPREVPLVVGGATVIGDGVLARAQKGNVVLCQLAPWQFDYKELYNTKAAFRRLSFAVSRMLGNMGVKLDTPLLTHFAKPPTDQDKRWLDGLYLEEPIPDDDDPYRFFRW